MNRREDREPATRQERRERRRATRKSKMTQHGKSIALVYRHGVEKRAGKKKSDG